MKLPKVIPFRQKTLDTRVKKCMKHKWFDQFLKVSKTPVCNSPSLPNDEAIPQSHFVEDDPMCRGCKLNKDEAARREFLQLVLFWMQDTQSFVAVQESSGRAVGVLVGRVHYLGEHTKTMSRTRIYQSNVLRKMQNFESHINKQVDVYSTYNTEACYKLHVWCVEPEHRDKGIGKALLRTAIEQSQEFRVGAVAGVFTGAVSQHIGRTMGFRSRLEILYWQWKEEEEPVFDDPGAGNNSADLMVLEIQIPQEVKDEEHVQESSTVPTSKEI